MASITSQSLFSLSKPKPNSNNTIKPSFSHHLKPPSATIKIFLKPKDKQRSLSVVAASVDNELDVIPVQSDDRVDQQSGVVCTERETDGTDLETVVGQVVGGFGNEASGRLSFEGASGLSSAGSSVGDGEEVDIQRFIDSAINATIVLAAGTFAITKLLTIDRDYWHSGENSWRNWMFPSTVLLEY